MKSHEFRSALRRGKYTSLGSYPTYFVTTDGGALCHACAKEECALICRAIFRDDKTGGWHVFGQDINYEDTELYCDHCSKSIESAYGDT